MASTIGTNVRGWREVSSAAHWTARVLWDTGTALYAVVQDTGATPKVRVMKADSRTAPTTWTEQDSADNKSIANVDYPFSSWLHTNGDLHIVAFSATNTLTHYVFDTDTDQWATGNGNISTAVENEHTVRCCVRSDGDILAFFTSNADDADLGWFVWQGANWSTGGVNGILSANSTGAANVLDAGIDSTDRAWVVFYNPAAGDVSYGTVDSANAVTTDVDIDATGPAALSQNSGARYALYDDAGTDKIVAAYRPQASAIEERVVTLEADANTANLAAEVSVEATTTDVGDRTPVSTAVVGGVPYCAWWDDAASGTIKVSTKSGGAWATETNVATGITKLIEVVPVGIGLVVVYQSSNDVLTDWIVDPFLAASLTVTPAESTAAGGTVTLTGIIPARVLVSWAEVEVPAAEGVAGTLTVTAADAAAAGGTVNLAAASLFAVTAAPATAAGGTVAFTAASKMVVAPADAEAPASYPLRNEEGEIVYGEDDQPVYVGGPPTLLTGQGALAVVAADAIASGGDVALVGDAAIPGTLTVDPATATADGGTVVLTGAALLTVTPADAMATGGDVTLDAASALTVTPADATAAGGTVAFAAASLFTVTPATATAAGGDVDLAGISGASLVVAPAQAWAGSGELVTDEGGNPVLDEGGLPVFAGPGVNLMAASLFAVTPATATADGGAVTLTASVPGSLAADPATASATGGTVSLTGQGILSTGTTPPPSTFVAASTAAAASDSVFVAKPTGAQEGDLLVACVAVDVSPDFPGILISDAGGVPWTTRATATTDDQTASIRVFTRIVGSADPSTYTANDSSSIAGHIRATILAYRPAAGTTLAVSADAQGSASGTSHATPSVTPDDDNAMLVVFGAATAGHSWTEPTGMTERADDPANMTIGAFDVVQATAASVSKTATLDTADVAVMAIVAATPVVALATATAAGGTVAFSAASLFSITPSPSTATAFGDLTGESDIPGTMVVDPATADAGAGSVLLVASATLTVAPAEAAAAGGTVALAGQGTLSVTPATASSQGEAVTFDAAARMTIASASASAESTSVLSGQGALAVTPATASAAASATLLGAATFTISSATATATADADFVASAPASLVVAPAAASASANATLTGNVAMVVSPADATATGDASFSASSVFTIDVAEAAANGTDVVLRAPQWFVLYARVMIDPAVSFSTRLAPSATGGDLRHGPSVSAALAVEAG